MSDQPPLFTLHDEITLDQQIEELERERQQRINVYPRFIERGILKPSTAMRRQMILSAAIATLRQLKQSQEGR